ncbi:MAG TPA: hypothetical protein VG204_20665 [Terriglobia bacterium]|nr:hypothetical protein [Terriglobia bacterium]
MPVISLTDNFGLALDVSPGTASAWVKYFRNLPSLRILGQNLAALKDTALQDFPVESGSLSLTFQDPVALGTGATELTVGAGASGTLAVCKGSLFADDPFGEPVPVSPGQAYLSMGIKASLSADSTRGDELTFGLAGGTQVSFSNYRLFPADTAVVAALSETLGQFSIPAGIEDLQALTPGTLATVDGAGTLKFAATANLLSWVNPLATVSAPVLPGALKITAGASIEAGASVEFSGNYQVRVQKLSSSMVRLGYYKEQDADFTLSVSARFGVSAGVGNFELISTVLSAISADPSADTAELKSAGLNDEQIGAIAAAIQAAVERRLELAITTELSVASQERAAAFLFEIDLGDLDAASRQALQDALTGDLSRLTEREDSLPPGIRLVRSILTSIHESKHTLKVNLLGIYNYLSISRLMLQGTILYEPTSGDLVITDAANAQRIRSSSANYTADSDKLRAVLAESFLITAAYRGTQLVVQAPELRSSYWYFELQAHTNGQTMRGNLDVPQALGMISEPDKQRILGVIDDFGRSTFYAETAYDDNLTTALFLDQAGRPRAEDEYDIIGRQALACLIHPDDTDAFRLSPLQDDSLWRQMRDAGPAALNTVLPNLPSAQIAVIATDYVVIRWWSQAMHGMAEKLAEVRAFFAQNPSPDPNDSRLQHLRRNLATHMVSVADNTREEFGHPWGLLAMDQAAAGRSGATVRIQAARLALQFERPAGLPASSSAPVQ